jgi:tetratricopeptide (TPR) repeat protein
MSRSLVPALRQNMRRALKEGRLEDAEAILARLKDEDPLSRETRGFELELYINTDRLQEAHVLARQLRRLFPESARIFFLAGKLAYRSKDYKEAEACFRESNRLYTNWHAQWWLGKALTQSGQFEEAESLLRSVRERTENVLLDLAWLYERRKDFEAALKAYEEFLAHHPDHAFAVEQRLRLRANAADPATLIKEVDTLAELGEEISMAIFPAYVQRLFETGNTIEARQRIMRTMSGFDAKTGSKMAWVCYHARAYDLACTLFLAHLRANAWYYKYLNALETAAANCGRLPEVVKAYRLLAPEVRALYGRLRTLERRNLQ